MTKLAQADGFGRPVEEWVGANPGAAIPDRVKLRIWNRYGGKCAITGRKLRANEAEYDHIQALALGGRHAESNLRLVSSEAHKTKTADDRGQIAKADRIARKHAGLWPRSKTPLKSRGFEKTRRVQP